MLTQKRLLLSSSAIIYAVSYIFKYAWWGIFIFLVPLFFCLLKYQINPFKDGLLWGGLNWTLQYYGILYLLYEKGEGEWRLFAALFLIAYNILYVMVWFGIINAIKTFSTHYILLGASSCAVTFLYFYWVRHHIYFIFNQDIGYCFGNPTLVLAQYPKTLLLLPLLGSHGVLALVITSSFLAGYAFFARSLATLPWSFIVLAPFAVGFFEFLPMKSPSKLQLFGYVSLEEQFLTPHENACAINDKIVNLVLNQPTVKYIVMPESAYPFYLNKHPNTLSLWGTNALAYDVCLLIGSYRCDIAHESYHNCLYKVRKSRIIHFYDKSSRVPFIEYFPWERFNCLKELFLKNKKEFAPRKGSVHPLILGNGFKILPLLCSDLFFDIPLESSYPLLCAVNDNWFSTSYMKRLMFLFAVYKSIQLQRDIIYVSYTKGVWLSPSTHQWPLLS